MSIFSKMKKWTVGRWIKTAIVTAAPVVGTVMGGPVVGAGVVTALGAAGLTKKAGQKNEEKGGKPIHKVAAPAVAVGIPAGLAMLAARYLQPEHLQAFCEFAQHMCPDDGIIPVGAAAVGGGVLGLISLLTHQLGSGAEKTIDGRQK